MALIAKMLACVGYGFIYLKLYKGEGDTLNYFRDVSILVNLFYDNPNNYFKLLFGYYYSPDIVFTNDLIWRETRMFVFVKICSIFQIIIGSDYRVMSLYMSLLSFWGVWYVANKFTIVFPKHTFSIALSFFFLPSVLLWGSGYSKESIVMWAFGVVIGWNIRLFFQKKFFIWDWIYFGIANSVGLFVLFLIKFYYVSSLVPALCASYCTYILYEFFLKKYVINTHKIAKYSLIFSSYFLIFGFLVLSVMYFYPTFWFQNLMFNIIYNHNVMYLQSAPEDLIHYSTYLGRGYINLDVSLGNMCYNTPKAFFSILFRPFLWETYGNKFKILASIENSLLLLGFMAGFVRLFFLKETPKKQEMPLNRFLFLWAMCVFVVVLYTLLALASPNLGSLSRYRFIGQSWVWFLVLYLVNFEKIKFYFKNIKYWKLKITHYR